MPKSTTKSKTVTIRIPETLHQALSQSHPRYGVSDYIRTLIEEDVAQHQPPADGPDLLGHIEAICPSCGTKHKAPVYAGFDQVDNGL